MLSKQEIDNVIELMADPETLPITVSRGYNNVINISTILNLRNIVPAIKYTRESDGEPVFTLAHDSLRVRVEGRDLNTLTLELWDRVRSELRRYYRNNTKE